MSGGRASHVESALRRVRNCPICRQFARTVHCKLEELDTGVFALPETALGSYFLGLECVESASKGCLARAI